MSQAARVQIRSHVIVQVVCVRGRGDIGFGVLRVDAVEIREMH